MTRSTGGHVLPPHTKGVPTLAASGAYRYVLELNADAVHAHGIRVGDTMRLTGIPRRCRSGSG